MSRRYKGAIISATPPTTSLATASGAWTLQQQMQAKAANAWPAANPYFILYGGTNYNAASNFGSGGLLVSPQGTVAITTNNGSATGQYTYLSNVGTVVVNEIYTSGQNVVYVNSAADPTWWIATQSYYYNAVLNSAPATWTLTNSKGGGGQDSIELGKIAVNGNGVTALNGGFRSGKVDVPTILLRDSSGTRIDGRMITANGPRSVQYTKIFAQTDNNFVYARAEAISEQQSWIVTPTSAVPTSKKQYTGGTGANMSYVQGAIDSSNNLYWCGISGSTVGLMRMNSSRVPTNQITWAVSSGSYTYQDLVSSGQSSMTQYGNYVYTCSSAFSGTSPNRVGNFFVICLNASDLTFVWGKRFSGNWTASGTNSQAGALGGGGQSSALGANQYGLWVKWCGGATQATAQLYAMKIPLDGSVVNGTYVVNSVNITISDYTPTLTVETVASTFTTNTPTTASQTDYTTANASISAGTTPTATKTYLAA